MMQEQYVEMGGEQCLHLRLHLLPCNVFTLFIVCIYSDVKRKGFKCRKTKVSSVI